MKSVYLAGPDVFLRNALAHGRHLLSLAEAAGLEGLLPLDAEVEQPKGRNMAAKQDFAKRIRLANQDLIRRADAIVVNMSPFRGPGMDGGSAFEIGFAHALGKPVIGYVEEHWYGKTYLERVDEFDLTDMQPGLTDANEQVTLDVHGQVIEMFYLEDNLMMATCLSAPMQRSAECALKAAADFLKVTAAIQEVVA